MIDAFDRFWGLLHQDSWAWIDMIGWLLVGLGALGLVVSGRPAARGAARPFWIALAILGPLTFAEMGWPVRFRMMGSVRSLVQQTAGDAAIEGRRPWQAALIVVTLAAAAALLAWLLRSLGRWAAPARLAAAGLLTALTGFALEFISLHQVDAHYGVYWTLWFAGLGMMLGAIGWAAVSDAPPAPATSARRDDASGARSYRIPGATSAAPADPAEPLGIRLRRLGWIGLLLALPEIAAWLAG